MKWLHIADLHLNDQGDESSRMRRGLVEYIKKQNMSIDYIFVAGDLRIGATGVFSSDTAEYLLQLCKVANVSPEKMFIVPGNHDVDRNNLERNAAIMRVLPPGNCKEGYYTPATGIIDNADLLSIKKGETEFIELMTQIYSNIPNRIDAYKSNPPHFSVEADDLNVIHIDSSLVYSKNQTRDLILGTKHLSDVLATVNKNKPTIILTHYSFDFLERSEQNEVFQLLKEAGVKIWISGHEHRNLARLQRNYFHEFQCGNLIIESDTRCCFLFGELDALSLKGSVQAHAWFSPDGWGRYPYIDPSAEKTDTYTFSLRDTMTDSNQAYPKEAPPIHVRKLTPTINTFNLYEINAAHFLNAPTELFDLLKAQLGNRLRGDESHDEIVSLFLAEVKMTLNSDKRTDCMPLFMNVVRDAYDAHIYINNNLFPAFKVNVAKLYLGDTDLYLLFGEKQCIGVYIKDGTVLRIQQEYSLSSITQVDQRLYYFNEIEKFISATKFTVRPTDCSHYEFCVDTAVFANTEAWQHHKNITYFWITEMKMIREIEDYYHINFSLPMSLNDDEHQAIAILNDAIHRKCCVTLPMDNLPPKGMWEKTTFSLQEELSIEGATHLQVISLMEHRFIPTQMYLLPCVYTWNNRKHRWENSYNGIPCGVEFLLQTKNEDEIQQ